MKQKKVSLFLLFFLCYLFKTATAIPPFAYISYSTYNVGDDIQAIAAKRFLPENSIGIDREFISQFEHNSKVNTIINGWFMQTKKLGWYLPHVKAPEKSWPPSPVLNPLLISIHFAPKFISSALSKEGIAYLKKHGPVGARDYYTLTELQKRGIPSYFSGCLTLTLDNPHTKREDVIYVVDLDNACINFIKSKTKYKVERLHHEKRKLMSLKGEERFQYAETFLEKYRKAKCVITSRLHAAMPCLAFKTPVLLIKEDRYRFGGLRQLVRSCSKKALLDGNVNFDFDNPPKNPTAYIPIRENLIELVINWVTQNLEHQL